MHTPMLDLRKFYNGFDSPTTEFDCGQLCAPHNPNRIPFCCDICHAVPAAYHQEWAYLETYTDLWHKWRGDECISEQVDPQAIRAETPSHLCLLACKGVAFCLREYRASSCRQFPFFPYITSDDRFIGLAYNWDFEDKCWVISHLGEVNMQYRQEFIDTYDVLLADWPDEYDSFYYLSEDMRTHFTKLRRRIPILHRNGGYYLLSPKSERMVKVDPQLLSKLGPYKNSR
jgi:hypothetical protein